MLGGIASPNPIPKAIHDRYANLETALRKMDLDAFAKFFAPKFISINEKGERTPRAKFLTSVKELFRDATSAEAKETLKSATLHGKVVAVSFDFTLKISNPEGWTQLHEVGTDYWQKINGRWLMIKTIDKEFSLSAVK